MVIEFVVLRLLNFVKRVPHKERVPMSLSFCDSRKEWSDKIQSRLSPYEGPDPEVV